jgi:deoxyribonuclease V
MERSFSYSYENYSVDKSPEKIRKLLAVSGKIAKRVVLEDRFSTERAAGVDQAFVMGDPEVIISGAVVLGQSSGIKEKSSYFMNAGFPYIPGLLSFREGPPAIAAVRALPHKPTLLFVDGCGINHPRRAGLASYIGVILDLPTVGVSKNILCGSALVPEKIGAASPLVYNEETVGFLLKSCKGCRPIVVAPGHKVSLQSSLDLARYFIRGHKLPEPCRLAHEHVNQVKRDMERMPVRPF